MIDHRSRQTESARRERRQLLFKDMTFEQAQAAAKEKRVPAGSVWHWSTGNMYGPMGSMEKNNGTTMSMDKERNIDRPPSVSRHDSQGDVEGDMYEPQYAHERYSDHQVEGWR